MAGERPYKPKTNKPAGHEARRKRRLKNRTPELWRKAVMRISDPDLRMRVACIVFWDYFGGRTARNRWPHLDEFVDRTDTPEVAVEQLIAGLVTAGFTPLSAKHRVEKASIYDQG